MIAQDALSTQKELYQVKEQRLALALDEYVRLNGAYKEKSSSRTSCKYSREYNVASLIYALQGILFLFRMNFQGLLGTPCTLTFLEIASLLFVLLFNIKVFCWREPFFAVIQLNSFEPCFRAVGSEICFVMQFVRTIFCQI